MFVCFSVFIIACGGTQAMEVCTLWHANTWLSDAVKALTVLASVSTALLLVQPAPKSLALPSPGQVLRRVNAELEKINQALQKRHYESSFQLLKSSCVTQPCNLIWRG